MSTGAPKAEREPPRGSTADPTTRPRAISPNTLATQLSGLSLNSTMATPASTSRASNSSVTNLALTGTTRDETKLKIKDPEPFRGDRSKFKMFSIQLKACIKFGGITKPEDQVIWASAYLRDRPSEWFEAYLEDHLQRPRAERKERTNEMFDGGIDKMIEEMRRLYGYEDETRKVLKELRNLKQKGPVTDYTAEFWRLTNKLERNDQTLWDDYYQGLKDYIKDAITEREEGDPETLQDLIDYAENLDKRVWQRKWEKTQSRGDTTKRYDGKKSGNHRRDPDAMDWEANMTVKTSPKHRPIGGNRGRGGKDRGKGLPPHKQAKPPMTNDQKKRFREGECLKCGRKGHYARDCRGTAKQTNMVKKEEPPHKNIAWTDCYDNNCYDHKEEKKKANWYPKQPTARKERRQVNMHRAISPTNRNPRVITANDQRMIMETYYWRQVRTDREAKELGRQIGDILHDDRVERRHEPLWVVTPPAIKIGRRKEDPETIPSEEIKDESESDEFNEWEARRPDCLTDRREHLSFWCLGRCETWLKENPLNRLEKAESPERTPEQEQTWQEIDEEVERLKQEELDKMAAKVVSITNQMHHQIRTAIDPEDRDAFDQVIQRIDKQLAQRHLETPDVPQPDSQPLTSIIAWNEKGIIIRTDQWTCLRCNQRSQVSISLCKCEGKQDELIYNSNKPHGGMIRFIHLTIRRYAAQQHNNEGELIATYPLRELRELPYTGARAQKEPEPEEDDSSSDEEVVAAPPTSIVAWSADRIIVRTCKNFRDWCKDPQCEQEAQHLHKYYNPHGLERDDYAECVWSTCHSKDCKRHLGPHLHQTCRTESRQTLPSSYFKNLPRQDEPERRRQARGLDAIDEAISDLELTKNDEAATDTDEL